MQKQKNLRRLSLGQLLQINWNRMSELSGMQRNDMTNEEKNEFRGRILIQNGFATHSFSDEETKNLIIESITGIKPKKYLIS